MTDSAAGWNATCGLPDFAAVVTPGHDGEKALDSHGHGDVSVPESSCARIGPSNESGCPD